MSFTELYKVNEEGDVRFFAGWRDDDRGAYRMCENIVWEYLGAQHTLIYWLKNKDLRTLFDDLLNGSRLPISRRLVFMSMWDRFLVLRRDIPILIDAYNECCNYWLGRGWDVGLVPRFVLALTDSLVDANCQGVCWNWASIKRRGYWIVEHNDIKRLYNIHLDKDHWSIPERMRKQWMKQKRQG